MISDILEFSKLDMGESDLEPVDVNIKKLFRNTLAMVKGKALNKGVQLLTDTDRAPEYVKADYKKLKKALYNLLSNAVKFTPKGGNIRLTANRVTGYGVSVLNTPRRNVLSIPQVTQRATRNMQQGISSKFLSRTPASALNRRIKLVSSMLLNKEMGQQAKNIKGVDWACR